MYAHMETNSLLSNIKLFKYLRTTIVNCYKLLITAYDVVVLLMFVVAPQ